MPRRAPVCQMILAQSIGSLGMILAAFYLILAVPLVLIISLLIFLRIGPLGRLTTPRFAAGIVPFAILNLLVVSYFFFFLGQPGAPLTLLDWVCLAAMVCSLAMLIRSSLRAGGAKGREPSPADSRRSLSHAAPGGPSPVREDGSSRQPYYFKEPENTACFTCRHVLEKAQPILYVTHDADDGAWQFLCGGDGHTEEDGRILCLREIVERDPSVNGLYGMPLGTGASREKVGDDWAPFWLKK